MKGGAVYFRLITINNNYFIKAWLITDCHKIMYQSRIRNQSPLDLKKLSLAVGTQDADAFILSLRDSEDVSSKHSYGIHRVPHLGKSIANVQQQQQQHQIVSRVVAMVTLTHMFCSM